MTPVDATAALHSALNGASLPSADQLKALITAGADVNAPDHHGLPMLLRVLSLGYGRADPAPYRETLHELLSLALQSGADIAAVTPAGDTAEDLAATWQDDNWALKKLDCETRRRAHPALMEKIAEIKTSWPAPDAEVSDEVVRDFMAQCYAGDVAAVDYHLHFWPEAKDWQYHPDPGRGDNGLISVVSNKETNQPDAALLLIAAGCNVNLQNDLGQTALMLAAGRPGIGSYVYISLLVDAGADETIRDHQGMTAFDHAEAAGTATPPILTAALAARAERGVAEAAAAVEKQQALNARLAADPRRFKFRL